MTAAEFAKTDEVFILACKLAKVHPSKRQAKKFLNQQGLAFYFVEKAKGILERKKK